MFIEKLQQYKELAKAQKSSINAAVVMLQTRETETMIDEQSVATNRLRLEQAVLSNLTSHSISLELAMSSHALGIADMLTHHTGGTEDYKNMRRRFRGAFVVANRAKQTTLNARSIRHHKKYRPLYLYHVEQLVFAFNTVVDLEQLNHHDVSNPSVRANVMIDAYILYLQNIEVFARSNRKLPEQQLHELLGSPLCFNEAIDYIDQKFAGSIQTARCKRCEKLTPLSIVEVKNHCGVCELDKLVQKQVTAQMS